MSNIVLNSGSGGSTLGTDLVAGVDYQKVKVTFSTDGVAPVSVDATHQLPVLATQTGTWNITNISGTVSLPTGAATAAKQPALGTAGSASADVITVQGIASMTALKVDGSAVTQPISAASLPLPSGASTAAKQPALGTAGSASADVITVQGIASMTAIKVDGSAVTQPVSIATNQPAGNVASGAADSGNPLKVGGKYNATPITLADGNRGDLQVDANGYLCVDIKAGAGSGGTALADNATFTRGTTSETPVAGVVETSAPTLTNGKAGALSLTTGGAVRVDISSGGISSGTAGTPSSNVVSVQGISSMTPIDGNVKQLNGTTVDTNSGVKSAGTLRVVLATDQPQLTNKLLVTPDANSAVNVAQMNGVAVTMGNGVAGTGVQRVAIASDNTAFTVNAAQSGTWTVQPGNTANTTAWLVQDVAGTTGGSSFNGFVGAASNNKTQIKGSAGTLYLVSVQNLAATPVYLKVFDKTSANVTAGTTACDYQFMIPGNTAGAGIVLDSTKGIAHANGITIMLTAGIATTDNTSVSANNQVVTIGYK